MASNLLLNHIGRIFSLDFVLYSLLLTSPPKNNLFVVFGPHGHTFTFFIYIVVMNCQILADAMSAHRIYSNLLLTYSCMIYLFFFHENEKQTESNIASDAKYAPIPPGYKVVQ